MSYRPSKHDLVNACKCFKIEITGEETIPQLCKILNNHHGKEYYKILKGSGNCYLSTWNAGLIDRHYASLKKQKPSYDCLCPNCHKELPIKKFMNLNNRRLKYCCDCRKEMGEK